MRSIFSYKRGRFALYGGRCELTARYCVSTGPAVTADIKEQESQRMRAKVAQYHQRLDKRDHFDLLGVSREAEPEVVREAFKNLAKQWHADAFGHVNLRSDDKKKLDEIFQRLNDAYETLTDPKLREEYLVFLQRSAAGMSTDVHGILRAEAIVDEALALMKRKQWSEAATKLNEARKLNPDDPLYDVHYAWTQLHIGRRSPEACKKSVGLLKAAIKRQENLPLAYQYIGQIYFNNQNYGEARKWWKQCLEYEPRNVDVQRGIRLINTRSQKQQQQSGLSGLLNRLLGKK
ncbi:MAG: DnaJ domain-containing protein [Myxococcota bacterium]